jgi:hypothetical protein
MFALPFAGGGMHLGALLEQLPGQRCVSVNSDTYADGAAGGLSGTSLDQSK